MEGTPVNFSFKTEQLEPKRVLAVVPAWREKLSELQLDLTTERELPSEINVRAVEELDEPTLAQNLTQQLRTITELSATDAQAYIAEHEMLQLMLARAFAIAEQPENTDSN